MNITEQDLRERYESMETHQLVELQMRGGLTEMASRVLQQVLAERSLSQEELGAVEAEVKRAAAAREATMAVLASRGARVGAQAIDFAVFLAIFSFAFLFWLASPPVAFLTWLLSVAYLLLADGLPGGQSVGKRVLGIAVVGRYTRKPCTYIESIVRNLPLLLLGFFDWIFICAPKRQRLGDVLASTVVVRVNHPKLAAVEW